jgi:hypothetical protein
MKRAVLVVAPCLLSIALLTPTTAGGQPTGPVEDLRTALGEIQTQLDGIEEQIGNLPPTWSRKLAASERFVVLSDFGGEAVLDRETGLVWEQSPSTSPPGSLFGAHQHCNYLTLGGRKGWRVPTLPELASLIHAALDPAALPFTDVNTTFFYWSASTIDPAGAWVLGFWGGGGGPVGDTGVDYNVWCVRGG